MLGRTLRDHVSGSGFPPFPPVPPPSMISSLTVSPSIHVPLSIARIFLLAFTFLLPSRLCMSLLCHSHQALLTWIKST